MINFESMIAGERKSCLTKQLSKDAKGVLVNHLTDLHSSLHMHTDVSHEKRLLRRYLKRVFKSLNKYDSARITTQELMDTVGSDSLKKYIGGTVGSVRVNDHVPRKIFGREKFGTSANCPDDLYPYEKPDGSCTDVQPDEAKREEGKHRRRERKALKAIPAAANSPPPKQGIFEKAKSLFSTTKPAKPAKTAKTATTTSTPASVANYPSKRPTGLTQAAATSSTKSAVTVAANSVSKPYLGIQSSNAQFV